MSRTMQRRPQRRQCVECGRRLPLGRMYHDAGEWRCANGDVCRLWRRQPTLDAPPPPDDPEPWPGWTRTATRCPTPRRLIGYRSVPVKGWAAPEIPMAVTEAWMACRSWSCDHCRRGRRMEVRKHIGVGLETDGRRFRFVTITFAEHLSIRDGVDVKEARRRVTEWVRSVRRELGRDFEYTIVLEGTKRGRVHWHLITATPRSWPKLPKCGRNAGGGCECPDRQTSRAPYRGPCLQKLAHRAGLGWVDVRAVRSPKDAVTYLSKYLTKEHATRPLPRYCRRYSYSRRWASGSTLGSIRVAYALETAARFGRSPTTDGDEAGPEVDYWEWVPPPPRER